MGPTHQLHELGQSLWLDNITRRLLESGALLRYRDEMAVTGLTSNPTIFYHALRHGVDYDAEIRDLVKQGNSPEELLFEIMLTDLRHAADLFRPVYDETNGVDGWVSLEISPLLAYDKTRSIEEAKRLYAASERQNILIKIPGTPEGIPAIEEAIFEGVPVNVTLLFSWDQYLAAAEAYLRGIERRIAADLDPGVTSVASVFVSRWDKAVHDRVPVALCDRLGIAVAKRSYKIYRELLGSPRYLRVLNAGGRPQRLLWASTGTKNPEASDVLYVDSLAAPLTVNTMPEATLRAFAEHGSIGPMLRPDGGDCEVELAHFTSLGIDIQTLAAQLQREGAEAFVQSWKDLLDCVESKGEIPIKRA